VTWKAADNPPGTVAGLVIHPDTPLPSPSAEIALPGLEGSQEVILPVGSAALELGVAYSLNSRTLTDKQTIKVRGFQDHDVWSVDLTASCLAPDGHPQWGAEVFFSDHEVSTDLEVEEIYLFSDKSVSSSSPTTGSLGAKEVHLFRLFDIIDWR